MRTRKQGTINVTDLPVRMPDNIDPEILECDKKNFETLIRAAKADRLVYGDADVSLQGGPAEHKVMIGAVNPNGDFVPLAWLIPANEQVDFRKTPH